MKVNQIILGLCILFLFLAGCKEYKTLNAPEKVTYSYDRYFQEFLKAVDTLTEYSNSIPLSTSDVLKNQIKKTRLAYKRIEFLFDYNHTKFTYLNINGGPLYKIDEDQTELPPIRPNGLQALDELIFLDDIESERSHIFDLALELQKAVRFIGKTHITLEFEDYKLIEAIRSGLIRVFTLGVTGFDTPGSQNALKEAEESLQVMLEAFQKFEVTLEGREVIKEYKHLTKTFQKGIKLLKSQSFDEFDRMTFLRECVNPLYKGLRKFASLSKMNSNRFRSHAHNYETDNLFDSAFLNSDFFQELSYLPLQNPQSIALGKILFYDPILSRDLKMSCASCHSPKKAFSDGLPTSESNIKGRFTKRNAPTLINATFAKRYFHDLRSVNLERQIAHVFENKEEFNLSFIEVTKRLQKSKTYLKLFKDAYDGISYKSDINQRSISNALAAYVNTLISFNSQFDLYVRKESNAYSPKARRGFNLFMGKAACGTCHFPPAFNGTVPPFYLETESEVLGVTIGFDTIFPMMDGDLGRYDNGKIWEKLPHFKHSFKTPGLRNIQLTAPYMHNGSFKTLEEVMEFYNLGGGVGMGLDLDNQTLSSDPSELTQNETDDIIAFLNTLTDTIGLNPGHIELPKFERQSMWNKRSISY